MHGVSPRTAEFARVVTIPWRLVSLTLLFVAVPGCGGIDQNDMRRYAIKRPKDDEAVSAPPAKPTSPSVDSQAANVQAANVSAARGSGTGIPQPNRVPPSTQKTGTPLTGMPSSAAQPVSASAARSRPEPNTELSDTRAADPSLSPSERRQISIDNLNRIATALQQYVEAKGTFPPHAIYSSAGQPLLSWRVALLPFLGYDQLYQAFQLNEPWNSPHNQRLAKSIPSVYQSPERFDARTNYLLPIGSSTAFGGKANQPPRRWEDGAANTVILVESNDDRAVSWIQPADYSIQAQSPTSGLNSLRSDGFFAIWGDGAVTLVPKPLSLRNARSMFSVDGGEPFSSYSVRQAAVAEVASVGNDAAAAPSTAVDTTTVTTTQSNAIASRAQTRLHATAVETSPFLQRAREAFSAGDESDAIDLLTIAYLTDEPAGDVEYLWVPGLRRPAMAVRYGVGLQYSGPNGDRFEKLAKTSDGAQAWTQRARDVESLAGDLAGTLLDFLASTPRFLPSEFQAEPAQKGRRRAEIRGIEFLGVASRNTLQAVARQRNVDVVMLFEIEERQSRTGIDIRETRLRLIDPFRRRELFVSPQVNSVKRARSLGTPLYDDPIDKAVREFEDVVLNQLQPQPIPAALRPRHAAKRAAGFRQSTSDSPLRALGEVKFYHQNDLLDVERTMGAYRQLIGADAALRMLAGRPEERLGDLARWTPRVRVVHARRGKSNDDDDD